MLRGMRARYRMGQWATLSLSCGLLACAAPGPDIRHKANLYSLLRAEDFSGAKNHMLGAKASEYGPKNAVLYYLDLAMVQHDGGDFKESDASFEKAQERIEELYTKSISRHGARYVVNDTTVDYPGEPFERALSYIFRALNYAFMGNIEEALVEVRKSNQFLSEFSESRRFETYKDDAFVQYLGGLLYEDAGKADDARISMEAARKAYERYATTYAVKFPHFNSARGGGELVFLHYNGMAPIKTSEIFRAGHSDIQTMVDRGDIDESAARYLREAYPGDTVPIAFPKHHQVARVTEGSDIIVGGKKVETLLAEDVAAIALGELKTGTSDIVKRAMARYKLKSWAAFVFTNTQGQGLGASGSEAADTRSWATLPAQIRMARVPLIPGEYPVVVRLKDASGKITEERKIGNVEIRAGRRTYLHIRTTR